jgi:predicted dienelactone hydrolase
MTVVKDEARTQISLRQRFSKLWRWGRALAVGTLAAAVVVGLERPSWSADAIIVAYGFFERTIPVADLEAFARGEGLSPQLAAYVRLLDLSDRELAQIQDLLNQPIRLDSETAEVNEAVVLSQFFYTRQGEALLRIVGDVVQTPSRLSGFSAIRAALLLAAADQPDGLTVLSFLRQFPTPAIRLDVLQGLAIADVVGETIQQAGQARDLIQALATLAAEAEPVDGSVVRSLIQALPPYAVEQKTLNILVKRQILNRPERRVVADLYLPIAATQPSLPERIPVIVVSHGLGDNRHSYGYLGNYLAARGFAVAVLEHPGSNAEQIAALLEGRAQDLVPDQEFIDRPQDVSALLDYLEAFAEAETPWRDRLDLENVGLVGQSFGGYTVLALAGAPLRANSTLAADCGPRLLYSNASLLLQCQAADIGDTVDFRDPRVKAVLAVNPIGSALFGPQGYGAIEVPVMMVAGVADTVAPALPEQIRAFTWLQTPERYLVLINQATHFSVIGVDPTADASIPVPLSVIGPRPDLAQRYLEVLSLGFFQWHLQQDQRYQTILTANYLQTELAVDPLNPISLIRELSTAELKRAITP